MAHDEVVGPIDGYIAGFPAEARAVLMELRDLVRDAIPDATESMAYGIPTFDLHGKHVVHFAGYAHHIGLYPTPGGMAAFAGELARYRRGKGSARFPLGEPMPTDLIRRIVAFRVEAVTAEAAAAVAKGRGRKRGARPVED